LGALFALGEIDAVGRVGQARFLKHDMAGARAGTGGEKQCEHGYATSRTMKASTSSCRGRRALPAAGSRPSRTGRTIIVPATGRVKGFIVFLMPDFTIRRP